LPIGAGDDEVRHGLAVDVHLPADQVGPGVVAVVVHLQAPDRLAALRFKRGDLLLGEVAVVVVVAQLRVAACGLVALLDLLRGGVRRVDLAGSLQLLQHLGVGIHALGLAVGLVRAAGLDPLVPVEAKPLQGVNDGLVGLLSITLSIRILDAEDQLATSVAGISPVKQRGAHHADVRGAGGRWTKTYANFTHGHLSYPRCPDARSSAGAGARLSPFTRKNAPGCMATPPGASAGQSPARDKWTT